jgi:hypothetical protein
MSSKNERRKNDSIYRLQEINAVIISQQFKIPVFLW